jgi:hypothetical protein
MFLSTPDKNKSSTPMDRTNMPTKLAMASSLKKKAISRIKALKKKLK